MREDVRLRVMQAAEHILESGATVRACAAKYGVSKTTIHKDMRERLPKLDGELSKEVDAVLKKNLEERHIRGGAATREKFRRSRPPPFNTKKELPQNAFILRQLRLLV